MKREYFAMLFITISVGLVIVSDYLFGEETAKENMNKYVVIWLLIAFYVGQYSMKFPKRF